MCPVDEDPAARRLAQALWEDRVKRHIEDHCREIDELRKTQQTHSANAERLHREFERRLVVLEGVVERTAAVAKALGEVAAKATANTVTNRSFWIAAGLLLCAIVGLFLSAHK